MQTREKTVDITLDYPVHLADRELEASTMRRPVLATSWTFPSTPPEREELTW